MEREFKHTPGPWTLTRNRKGSKAHISGQNWERFARVYVRIDSSRKDLKEGVANAKLIAASPTMLQTLERIANCNDLATAQEYARDAINKATS